MLDGSLSTSRGAPPVYASSHCGPAMSRSNDMIRIDSRLGRMSPSRKYHDSVGRRRLRFEPLEDRRMLAAGDLDPSFNGTGKLTTDFGAFGDIAQSVAIQADGKIVVAGRSNSPNNGFYDFALARYNTNGSLDTSFSGDGKLTTPIGTGDDFGYAVAIQADGKIIVVGSSSNDFAVVRYNTDGSLDTSFSGDGKQTTSLGSGSDTAQSVEIQADGKKSRRWRLRCLAQNIRRNRRRCVFRRRR